MLEYISDGELEAISQNVFEGIKKATSTQEIAKIYHQNLKEYDFNNGHQFNVIRVKIGYKVLEKIYEKIDLNNPEEMKKSEKYLKFTLKGTKYLSQEWSKTVEAAVKNLILEGKGKFDFRIDSYKELTTLVNSWRNAGLFIKFDNIENEIIQDFEKSELSKEKKIRVAQILDHYANDSQLRSFIKEVQHSKMSRQEIKEKVRALDKSEIELFNGRHVRRHNLARYFKILSNFKCENCGKEQDNEINFVEVSHIIPLYVGPSLGGVDRTHNMEILCKDCHKSHEEEFARNFFSIDKSQRANWIRSNYPCRPE